jgi:cyclomaltodextrinase
MDDFIFGTLSTETLRLTYQRELRRSVTHHHARAPRDPKPSQPVELELSLGPEQAYDQAWVYWSTDGQEPVGNAGLASQGFATPMEAVGSDWDLLEWGYLRRFRAVLPGQPGGTVVRYTLAAEAANGKEILADQGQVYAYYVADDPPPEWAYDAIIYQIFSDRFNPGAGRSWLAPESLSGFFGGTLRGITEKLDYIAELGANAIWLTPIFPSPSHHRYDTTDYFAIDPRLGDKNDLRALIDGAHQRGVRLLLDFVPNHVSNLHSAFQRALADQNSPEASWFTFHHWPDEYKCYFDVKELPELNLRHPAARQHLLDAAAYWLEFGVDGYRVDYAIGPTPDFWADFRRVTRSVNPDCWTFGEVVEPSYSQLNFHGLLDGCLDFILLEGLRQTFAFRRWNGRRFASFLERHEAYFPLDFTRPSFLDNHDMNRYLWAAGGDKDSLKLAALCQFTLAGPPVIYYGTECGLSQERDVRQDGQGIPEEARLPMTWGEAQDAALLDYYRSLARLRRERASLRRGARRALHADELSLAYQRQHQSESTAIAINLSAEPRSIFLPGQWHEIALASRSGAQLTSQPGGANVELPPFSGAVLI